MFLSIVTYDGGRKRIIPLSEIREVDPGKHEDQTVIRLQSGASVSWRMPYDRAQDVLLDCATQVTAPIASRIMGLENTAARLCRSMEDFLEQANTPILSVDSMTPEEAERFKKTMRETEMTLNSIQPVIMAGGSVTQKMLETDVEAVCQLLEDHEWAEHCTSTKLGQRLESAVTELHNEQGETREKLERLERAETLLAEVWHLWNNDDGVSHALGQAVGTTIGNFLYP
ncbi:hypothetical protein [Kosakonia phage Kc237]|nr:hypothetical protein [Kosakonia phage Kc237]